MTRTCQRPDCDLVFHTLNPKRRYCCDACKRIAAKQRRDERLEQRRAEIQARYATPAPAPEPRPKPKRPPAGYRAPSLAMAGDTPSREAVYRDCLTGAASATVHRGGQAAGGHN